MREFSFFTAGFPHDIIMTSTESTDIDVCENDSDKVCSKKLEILSPDLIGQFCLVLYDGKAYPGKVLKVDVNDDDAMVQCMCQIGENRFFWPVCTDIAWYMREDILTLIPEPLFLGRNGRHYQVLPSIWNEVSQKLYGCS